MSNPEQGGDHSGLIGSRGPSMMWRDIGFTAMFLGVLVAPLTFGGVDLIGSAIAPEDKHGAVTFGAVLLGFAAGVAVFGVIQVVRKAVIPEPEPPSSPRTPGKVEI